MALAVGASIVLYLEDDFAEPDSIPASDRSTSWCLIGRM